MLSRRQLMTPSICKASSLAKSSGVGMLEYSFAWVKRAAATAAWNAGIFMFGNFSCGSFSSCLHFLRILFGHCNDGCCVFATIGPRSQPYLWAVSGWKCHASGQQKLQQQLLQWRRPESHTPGIKSQHMHTFTQRHGWMHGTGQSSNTDVQNFDWFISVRWLPQTRNTLQQPSHVMMGQESKKWGSGDVRDHHITWTFATNSRKMLSLGILCNQLRWYRGLNNEARFSRLETTPGVVRFKHALGPSYTYTHTIHTRVSVEQCVNNSS